MLKTPKAWGLGTRCSSLGFWWADLGATGGETKPCHWKASKWTKYWRESLNPRTLPDSSCTWVLMQSLGPVITVIPHVILLLLLAYNVLTCANQNLLAQSLVLWYVTVEDVAQPGAVCAGVLAHSVFRCSNLFVFKLSANQDLYEKGS